MSINTNYLQIIKKIITINTKNILNLLNSFIFFIVLMFKIKNNNINSTSHTVGKYLLSSYFYLLIFLYVILDKT